MKNTLFEQNILNLNFSFVSQKRECGVLLTNDYLNLDSSIVSPNILFALEIAKDKFRADAVYFRYFEDGRGAIPQLYLFDFTLTNISDEDKSRIHKQMWNGYQVPAYIIIEKHSVSVFDAREKPDESKSNCAKAIIKRAGEAINRFEAKSFDDGLFWEKEELKNSFKFEQSATRDLIRGLKKVYEDFQKHSNLNSHVALKLLVQCLLIKYLEERDEDTKSGYFAKTYFKTHFNCNNFCDTIRKGKLLILLDKLADDFNGKIFEWDKEDEAEERVSLQRTEVNSLADYLDGDNQDSQYVLWRLYSFSHLPVEIISSVYEELLTDSKDIVYTPEMLVSTMVDECMPLKNPQKEFKLIDVSCGSGIYLVKAYKRIVQWWRYEEWQKTGNLVKPSLPILKELLLNSIYGRDIQQDAIRLSIFSLALAILDEVDLDPPTWGKLKFPDLRENIKKQDFFEYITSSPSADFDLVIGNPPFNLQEINDKEPNRKKYFKELYDKVGYKSEVRIPDENPALHFTTQSMKLLKPDGLLCLIQPSGPLLYQKDIDFKLELFSKYNLLQVIDFTKLADKLWGRKNIATLALFMQKSIPDNKPVLHLVANRLFSNCNRLFLEFDHYDFHFISKEATLSSPHIWKANLLGGGRIVQLIDRLSTQRTLGKFLDEKKEAGWIKGEGFIEKGDKNVATYITGKSFLPTESFTENDNELNLLSICNIQYFHRPRNEKLYTAPHLIIRKIIGKKKLISKYESRYLTFLSNIFSIHCPEKDKNELMDISNYLDSIGVLLRFYILATSSRVKINKATSLYDEDILNIPYPDNITEAKLSEAENIILEDSLKYFLDNENKNILDKWLTNMELFHFAEIFCKTLNSVYESEGKSFQLFKILDAGKYYALHFEYTKENYEPILEENKDLDAYINQIIPTRDETQTRNHIQRIMKIYGNDCIILAKPKQLRYWLPSIALRDADESFSDYIKARYHQNA